MQVVGDVEFQQAANGDAVSPPTTVHGVPWWGATTTAATTAHKLVEESSSPAAGGRDHQNSSLSSIPPPPGEYVQTAYPYPDPYFGSLVAGYGAQGMVHPHMIGLQQARMLLPSEIVEEEPVYVNAKQYHGILRRRQSRAKAESENRLVKYRKPYLHESRHQHALKRARGCGGRFLNTKEAKDGSSDDVRVAKPNESSGNSNSNSNTNSNSNDWLWSEYQQQE